MKIIAKVEKLRDLLTIQFQILNALQGQNVVVAHSNTQGPMLLDDLFCLDDNEDPDCPGTEATWPVPVLNISDGDVQPVRGNPS